VKKIGVNMKNLNVKNGTFGYSKIYIVGSITQKIWEMSSVNLKKTKESIDYGTTINFITRRKDKIFIGGANTNGKIWRMNKQSLAFEKESEFLGSISVATVAPNDGNLYVGTSIGSPATFNVVLVDPESLEILATSPDYTSTIRTIRVGHSGSVYAVGFGTSGRRCRKYHPITLELEAESAFYENNLFGLAIRDNGSVYIGGQTTRQIWKLNPITLQQEEISQTYSADIFALEFGNDGLLYASIGNTLVRINPDTLATITTSAAFPTNFTRALAKDSNGDFYASFSTSNIVRKIDRTTLATKVESLSYGGSINGIIV
jgi:hypothetical protein